MRAIPGTITEYIAGQDQVDLLDLDPEQRAAKIKEIEVAKAQRKANDALAELRAAQGA